MKIPLTPHEEMVLLRMQRLADKCLKSTNPEDIYDRFAEARELYTDLRPTPTSAGEKATQRHLDQQFESCMVGDGFESAAYKMIPHYAQAANGKPYIFGLTCGYSASSRASAKRSGPEWQLKSLALASKPVEK